MADRPLMAGRNNGKRRKIWFLSRNEFAAVTMSLGEFMMMEFSWSRSGMYTGQLSSSLMAVVLWLP